MAGYSTAQRWAGAPAVGLIDLSGGAGLSLHVDRVGVRYRHGPSLGDLSAAVQLSATVRGGRPVPARAMPEVVARIGLGPGPAAVTSAGDVTGASQAERALMAADPPPLLLPPLAELLDALPVANGAKDDVRRVVVGILDELGAASELARESRRRLAAALY